MKDNSKTDYVFGYMYDLWLFSVGAKLSDAGVLKADKPDCLRDYPPSCVR